MSDYYAWTGHCRVCDAELTFEYGSRAEHLCSARCRRAFAAQEQTRIRETLAKEGGAKREAYWIKYWRSRGILKVTSYDRVGGGRLYVELNGRMCEARGYGHDVFTDEAEARARIGAEVQYRRYDAMDYAQRAEKKLARYIRERDAALRLGIDETEGQSREAS
jgi:hypothetical protein